MDPVTNYAGEPAMHAAPPPIGRRALIDHAEQLPEVIERLLSTPVLGVDVEAGIPPRERHSRFALLQIAIPDETYAIDPLRLRDLSSLAPVFESERIVKVFHGIALDRDMLESAGLGLRHVSDLSEVARSAYGKGEASLMALTRRAFGIGMDKSFQRGAWLHRPLTLPLLNYAYRDAELTLGLYHWLLEHEPELLSVHTTLSPRTELPEDLPSWLHSVVTGSRTPAYELLSQADIDMERDLADVLQAIRRALRQIRDPFLRTRVYRAIGDLQLYEMEPELTDAARSRAAHERAAALRALSAVGDVNTAVIISEALDDATLEVREAAASALQALRERQEELAREPADAE